MDLDSLDDDDAQQLADRIGPHLDPGQYGDKLVLSRRQAIELAGGTLGAGALLSLGVDPAVAQAAGSQGTPDSPNNMYAYDLNIANSVTSSLPMNGNPIVGVGGIGSAGQVEVTQGGDRAIVSKDDSFVGMSLESYRNSSSDHGIFNFYAARGTESSPAAIQNSDTLATIRARAHNGSDFDILGRIKAQATEDISDTANGQKWVFTTVPAGTTSEEDTAAVIESGLKTFPTGDSTDPAIKIGNDGAGVFVNSSGEMVVVDEAGNTTVLS